MMPCLGVRWTARNRTLRHILATLPAFQPLIEPPFNYRAAHAVPLDSSSTPPFQDPLKAGRTLSVIPTTFLLTISYSNSVGIFFKQILLSQNRVKGLFGIGRYSDEKTSFLQVLILLEPFPHSTLGTRSILTEGTTRSFQAPGYLAEVSLECNAVTLQTIPPLLWPE